MEAGLAAAWIVAPWRDGAALLACVATAALLIGYGAAITGGNLARGRSWIDCGCGGGEQLSWILVGRNAALATLALAPLALTGAGNPAWGDLAMALPVFAAGACLYLATGALVANAAAMLAVGGGPAVSGALVLDVLLWVVVGVLTLAVLALARQVGGCCISGSPPPAP